MTDRLKFRVWDKELNKYLKEVDVLTYMPFKGGQAFGLNECIKRPERYIIEQCTALKDKNGDLIYENDFLSKMGLLYKVKRNDYTPAFVMENQGTLLHTNEMFEMSEMSEIIGNVHENKELLNEDNWKPYKSTGTITNPPKQWSEPK